MTILLGLVACQAAGDADEAAYQISAAAAAALEAVERDLINRLKEEPRIQVERIRRPRELLIQVVIPNELLCAFAQTRVLEQGRVILTEIAGILAPREDLALWVVGHTDTIGTQAYNQNLTIGQAQAVADLLVAEGLPQGRIEAEGRGEVEPRASNATLEGQEQNRRTELRISYIGPERPSPRNPHSSPIASPAAVVLLNPSSGF